jgi:hypothetical protein
MGLLVSSIAIVIFFLFSACSSTEWVHRYKKQDEFVYDYNRCEKEGFNAQNTVMTTLTPYLQAQIMEKCLRKEGWVKRQ